MYVDSVREERGREREGERGREGGRKGKEGGRRAKREGGKKRGEARKVISPFSNIFIIICRRIFLRQTRVNDTNTHS